MTSPARVFAILDLFCEERPIWHADDINEALGYSRATGYRYVKDLVDAGFLQKVSAGHYSLGARIIQLDYQLRRSDPVLLAAVPVMNELARKSTLDAVLTTMFGTKVIDTYRASSDPTLELNYGRGRPRPLFLGAAPKVILSCMARPQLVRIYEADMTKAADCGLGKSWAEFRDHLSQIRKQGFYLSDGELDRGIAGAAVPICNADGEAAAALTLVGSAEAVEKIGEVRLRRLLNRAREDIQAKLADDFQSSGARTAMGGTVSERGALDLTAHQESGQ
ncbi:IclR family transcriptional regulator C-terminal domain-containing protein [Cupriavidus sp. CV2]|uniref:IclR family transcriptional regulator n=1 Tax=Cupriavidus ulmosensis TaxID=3065913 RepID=UPI00296ABA47|nr:IclR family transcriptional regulator C-terminal domain-containing protein [Cupriavidus sp. CV2]MDW3688233.1 IclR family transcriptional regulator C-terminal domain-containing protein [Cupriavidus sp. CV2]